MATNRRLFVLGLAALAGCSPHGGVSGDGTGPRPDSRAPDMARADSREGGADSPMTPDSGAQAPGTFELQVGARRLRLHLLHSSCLRKTWAVIWEVVWVVWSLCLPGKGGL